MGPTCAVKLLIAYQQVVAFFTGCGPGLPGAGRRDLCASVQFYGPAGGGGAGEHLAQRILVRVPQVDWLEVEEMEEKSRGGFGSTGG